MSAVAVSRGTKRVELVPPSAKARLSKACRIPGAGCVRCAENAPSTSTCFFESSCQGAVQLILWHGCCARHVHAHLMVLVCGSSYSIAAQCSGGVPRCKQAHGVRRQMQRVDGVLHCAP